MPSRQLSQPKKTRSTVSDLKISIETEFVSQESDPDQERFVFSYTVTIENHGQQSAQLLNRHWVITDGSGEVQEVRGAGVVGKQPHIPPAQGFRYTSGCVLETPVGSMRGAYEFQAVDGSLFEVEIPLFSLTAPGALH